MPGALLNTDSLGAVLSCSEAPKLVKDFKLMQLCWVGAKSYKEEEEAEGRKGRDGVLTSMM